MSFLTLGSVSINATRSISKDMVFSVNSVDNAVLWSTPNTLTRYCLSADWSTSTEQSFVTSDDSIMMESYPGRIFQDLNSLSKEWLIVPYITEANNLDISVLEMTGSNPTTNDFIQTYPNVIDTGGGESYYKMYPLIDGVVIITTLANGYYRLNGYSYDGSDTGWEDIDVGTTAAAETILYNSDFPTDTVFCTDKDQIYCATVESNGALSVKYIGLESDGTNISFVETVSDFVTLANGVTTVSAVRSISAGTRTSGTFLTIVYETAIEVYVGFTNIGTPTFESSSEKILVLTPPVSSSGTGLYKYDRTTAYLNIPNESFLGTVDSENFTIVDTSYSFTGTQKIQTITDTYDSAINLSFNKSTNDLNGVAQGSGYFGPTTRMEPDFAESMTTVGQIRNSAVNSAFWSASNLQGSTQTLYRYTLTYPPPLTAPYLYFTQYLEARSPPTYSPGLTFGRITSSNTEPNVDAELLVMFPNYAPGNTYSSIGYSPISNRLIYATNNTVITWNISGDNFTVDINRTGIGTAFSQVTFDNFSFFGEKDPTFASSAFYHLPNPSVSNIKCSFGFATNNKVYGLGMAPNNNFCYLTASSVSNSSSYYIGNMKLYACDATVDALYGSNDVTLGVSYNVASFAQDCISNSTTIYLVAGSSETLTYSTIYMQVTGANVSANTIEASVPISSYYNELVQGDEWRIVAGIRNDSLTNANYHNGRVSNITNDTFRKTIPASFGASENYFYISGDASNGTNNLFKIDANGYSVAVGDQYRYAPVTYIESSNVLYIGTSNGSISTTNNLYYWVDPDTTSPNIQTYATTGTGICQSYGFYN